MKKLLTLLLVFPLLAHAQKWQSNSIGWNWIYNNGAYADSGDVRSWIASATGSAITTVGTITSGVWHGTAIGDTYISSAATWNAKQGAITTGTTAQFFLGDLSLATFPTTTSGFSNSTNKNFVTDAQLTVIGNTSGTNTGDQSTITGNAGTATILQTTRSIYGNNFNGSAALGQVIASTYGGTGNGFAKFSGPTTSEKTFTLPDASATILTSNAVVTAAQGGTGISNNAASTLTISGNFGTTFTVSGTTSLTFPTSGTLLTTTGSAANLTSFPTLNQNTSGSAATLTTPRAINGVNFDGSGAITVTAAAGTLTGATLNSGVTASSLTSIGTITSGGLGTGAVIGGVTATLGSDASYDIYYRNSSGILTRLAAGADGNYLRTHSTTSAPDWNAPPGGGDMILASVQSVSGNKTFAPGTLIRAAGTSALAADVYTLTSAALLTSAVAGNGEVDANGIRYWTHATSERGVVDAEQFISLTSTYTLTSQTAIQKLFNSTTNGQVTVASSKSYFFEAMINLTSLSSSSSTMSFGFGGTATFTSIAYYATSLKPAALTTPTSGLSTIITTAALSALISGSTNTSGWIVLKGIMRINAGGTVIPSFGQSVAAAAVVGVNSYFRLYPIGTNTITNVGNWN